MREINGGITAPEGFKATGVRCGLKEKNLDLALIYSGSPAVAWGMFTTNKVKAAPVKISLKKIRAYRAQAIVANSDNANACTGKKGLLDASKMTEITAQELKISSDNVLVASTGIIGKPLSMDKIEEGIKKAVQSLSSHGGDLAAQAILTTDKVVKQIALETDIPGRGKKKVKIGGITKGSGMISPNLATMLCFITTDACITKDALKEALPNDVSLPEVVAIKGALQNLINSQLAPVFARLLGYYKKADDLNLVADSSPDDTVWGW